MYPEWLTNMVMMKKPNRNRRICVDFTNLNKVCPKDNFPFPKIDQLVDFMTSFEYLSSLHTNLGYHQISIHPTNEEITGFITDQGIFCYQAMLFDLKNTGVTSQQIMNKVFNNQIGQNIEAYIDSMLVKNMNFKKYLQDLKGVFSLLHQYQIKLNPTKYAFVINGGKFLSFLVRTKEIEPNPKKIQVIMNMTNF
jgi:hypothetical protein